MSHYVVASVVSGEANLRPANGSRLQNGRNDRSQKDKVHLTDNDRAYADVRENIYDEINLPVARAESEQNQYLALISGQDDIVSSIHTKLDALETRQDRLTAQVQHSQTQIMSELSQVKDMVNSLGDLVKTALATFNKMSADQEQRVHELAANLGQEVFQVGQEVMVTIRERNDEDVARETWRQQLDSDRMSSLSYGSKKKSSNNALPCL